MFLLIGEEADPEQLKDLFGVGIKKAEDLPPVSSCCRGSLLTLGLRFVIQTPLIRKEDNDFSRRLHAIIADIRRDRDTWLPFRVVPPKVRCLGMNLHFALHYREIPPVSPAQDVHDEASGG
jgi:hypothetical protein